MKMTYRLRQMRASGLALMAGLLVFPAILPAQSPAIAFTPEDRVIFDGLMEVLATGPEPATGEAMIASGKAFLGTPYVEKTLEVAGQEQLVVNLRGLDCTTFVENALAITRIVQAGERDWESYLSQLMLIRYRDGRLQGYPSRLHYFTDWIRDNSEKGLIRDITGDIGGVPVEKRIDFMGTHPGSYPALSSEANLKEVRKIEAGLSSIPYHVLPRESVARQEGRIQDGDIIALATRIPGLDVTHTGIALRQRDGRIYLLHASTQGEVMISQEPLAEYLKKIKGNTGILVARPLPADN